ncbi:hypothetical protein C8R43DRAFT_1137388 [Mycena crocata]|nr:hypothetical protein C8R43DRAFT_1137388 [Mycena crocata]
MRRWIAPYAPETLYFQSLPIGTQIPTSTFALKPLLGNVHWTFTLLAVPVFGLASFVVNLQNTSISKAPQPMKDWMQVYCITAYSCNLYMSFEDYPSDNWRCSNRHLAFLVAIHSPTRQPSVLEAPSQIFARGEIENVVIDKCSGFRTPSKALGALSHPPRRVQNRTFYTLAIVLRAFSLHISSILEYPARRAGSGLERQYQLSSFSTISMVPASPSLLRLRQGVVARRQRRPALQACAHLHRRCRGHRPQQDRCRGRVAHSPEVGATPRGQHYFVDCEVVRDDCGNCSSRAADAITSFTISRRQQWRRGLCCPCLSTGPRRPHENRSDIEASLSLLAIVSADKRSGST